MTDDKLIQAIDDLRDAIAGHIGLVYGDTPEFEHDSTESVDAILEMKELIEGLS